MAHIVNNFNKALRRQARACVVGPQVPDAPHPPVKSLSANVHLDYCTYSSLTSTPPVRLLPPPRPRTRTANSLSSATALSRHTLPSPPRSPFAEAPTALATKPSPPRSASSPPPLPSRLVMVAAAPAAMRPSLTLMQDHRRKQKEDSGRKENLRCLEVLPLLLLPLLLPPPPRLRSLHEQDASRLPGPPPSNNSQRKKIPRSTS